MSGAEYMKRLIIVISLFTICNVYSQPERLSSMGGMRYIVADKYVTLNPFDFGGNPAWIYKDDMDSWLKMQPSYSGYSGDYKRKYDPQSENIYGIGFIGLKTLGEDGTFLGETSYEYNQRKQVPRSLKRNTYAGEAFFFADTTTGNFRYNGPKLKFSYSFEPVNNLYTGASVSYRILDGLKDIYSRAEVLYRDIEGVFGAAYQLTDNLAVGMNYIYSDNQEKIVSDSEDLMEVEVFNYHGETYSVRKREGSVSQKVKGSGNNLSAQIYWRPDISSEVAITGSYGNAKQRILMPYNTSELDYTEYEEGYTSFNTSSLLLRSRFELFRSFFAGITAGYSNNYVWTKHSDRDRTMWEWEIDDITAGAGLSYQFSSAAMIAVEYDYINLKADSSKYIDAKFSSITSGNHQVRVGAEYEMMKNVYLRLGYNLSLMEKDIIFGGDNVNLNRLTAGAGIYIFPSMAFDIQIEYGFYKGLPSNLKKSGYSGITTVKLYSF
jgi:opacity protein-like surface antigen